MNLLFDFLKFSVLYVLCWMLIARRKIKRNPFAQLRAEGADLIYEEGRNNLSSGIFRPDIRYRGRSNFLKWSALWGAEKLIIPKAGSIIGVFFVRGRNTLFKNFYEEAYFEGGHLPRPFQSYFSYASKNCILLIIQSCSF